MIPVIGGGGGFSAKIISGSFDYRQSTSSTHNIALGVSAKIVRVEMADSLSSFMSTIQSGWVVPGSNPDGYGWRLSQDGKTLTYAHRGTGSDTAEKTAQYTCAIWY